MAKARLKFDDDLMGDVVTLPALSKEHEDFCQAVVATGNPAEAYRRSVMTSPETKPTTVWSQATRLMAKPSVRARINELKLEAARYAHITPGKIMAELGKIAFFDIRKTLDDNGNLLPVHLMDEDTVAGIAGLELDVNKVTVRQDIYHDSADEGDVGRANETTTVTSIAKIKLADKRAALMDLSKLVGMQVDKIEHSAPDGAPLIPQTDNETARRIAFLLAQGLEVSNNAERA